MEYYNRPLDAYFITSRANEQALLDAFMRFSRNTSGLTTFATQMFAMRSLDRGATWSTPVFVGDYLELVRK